MCINAQVELRRAESNIKRSSNGTEKKKKKETERELRKQIVDNSEECWHSSNTYYDYVDDEFREYERKYVGSAGSHNT